MKKKEFDLTNEKDIQKALYNLEGECLNEFEKSGFIFCPFAIVSVCERALIIGIIETDKMESSFGRMASASDIQFYCKLDDTFNKRENEINFGSSGSFNPSIKSSYWRTLHAAELLRNWGKACEICNDYCAKYKELQEKIREANKKEPTKV